MQDTKTSGNITKNIENKLHKLESKFISEIKWEVDNLLEQTVQDVKNDELTSREFGDFFQKQNENIWHNRLQISNNETNENEKLQKRLPEKIFMPRESYLTHLLQVPHMKCVYNIFFALLCILTLHTFILDYVTKGKINIGIKTIQRSYGGFHYGIFIWCCMHLAVFSIFYAFKFWANIRFSIRKNKNNQKIWDYTCATGFVIFQLLFAYIVSIATIRFQTSFITSTAVLLEMTRLMMKMHAFVRTNASIQLTQKLKTDDTIANDLKPRQVKFSKYLYFLFAPTLLYRDEYPRTKIIRWNFVMARISEIIGTNFLQACLYERYLTSYYLNFGKQIITPGELVQVVFASMMPAIIIWLSGFYVILHSTQNAMAEILKFADRMFYKDWWTSTNYSNFYRTWNIIVHDWLYEYIYKDIYTHVFKGSKTASIFIVFFSSAFVHEYILAVLLKFVLPVMFILFMIYSVSVMLLFEKFGLNLGNFMLWFTFITGNGMLISFYSMEYFARQNCPVGNQWIDYFIPVSLSCNGIVL